MAELVVILNRPAESIYRKIQQLGIVLGKPVRTPKQKMPRRSKKSQAANADKRWKELKALSQKVSVGRKKSGTP